MSSQEANSAATAEAAANSTSAMDKPIITTTNSDSSEDPPSPISSENLLRRPSFKRILEDLSSSAETTLSKGDPLASAASATLQAQAQQAVLQQSLTNPALLPSILQGLQQSSSSGSTTNSDAMQLAAAMMNAQSNALLNSTAHSLASGQSPLIASAATLAGQNNLQLPVNLLSSAILNAASNNALSNQLAQLAASSPLNSSGMVKSPGDPSQSPGEGKREVRLMKNREAARECRRKKKEYIRCLENRVAVLESQNQALIGELRALKELYLPKNQE